MVKQVSFGELSRNARLLENVFGIIVDAIFAADI